MKVDKTDKQILAILQKDGRVSASNIATELDISIPTVTDRIKKLQDSGIIKGRLGCSCNYHSNIRIFISL